MTRQEFKVCGNGGQGVITMGMLLTQAATLHDNVHAVCTESYGPQSRGGDVWIEVILDRDEPVDYPRVTKADGLVALNPMSYRLYSKQLKPGGALLYDPSLLPMPDGPGKWPIPCFQAAAEVFQKPQTANIIMLGAVERVLHPVSEAAMEKAVAERYPKLAELNRKALHHGFALADLAKQRQGGGSGAPGGGHGATGVAPGHSAGGGHA